MAERRRRRKPMNDGESDHSSDESIDEPINRAAYSDAGSEYESADEEDILPAGAEADQEEIDAKLDDDEDRKNPQYIPKKGTFYEHDDRTCAGEEEGGEAEVEEEAAENGKFPGANLPVVNISETQAEQDDNDEAAAAGGAPAKQIKKKVWRGDEDRWCHDKFEEHEQAPKDKDELVMVYGYDIRSEEGAPRARRRRRYGRGPNKYTRNWEDYDAYARPSRGGVGAPEGGRPRGRGRGARPPKMENKERDFPALPGQQDAADTNNKQKDDPVSVGSSSGSAAAKQHTNINTPPNNNNNEQPYNSLTYTNQEYRRRQDHHQERGRGAASTRGRGSRGKDRGGGRGRGSNYDHHQYGTNATRGSDDVRFNDSKPFNSATSPQHHSNSSSPRHRGTEVDPQISHGHQEDSTRHHHQLHHTNKNSRGGGGTTYPRNNTTVQQQQQQQQYSPPHQGYNNSTAPAGGAGRQQKRYSSQRGPNPRGGGAVPSASTGGANNPHYTPHPHHNLYYHDTNSTTPPPQTADVINATGLVGVNVSSSGGVMNSSGAAGGVVDSGVVYEFTPPHRHHPPHSVPIAPSQFVPQVPPAGAPPAAPYAEDPSAATFLASRAGVGVPPVSRGLYNPSNPQQPAPHPPIVGVLPPPPVLAATTVAPPFLPTDTMLAGPPPGPQTFPPTGPPPPQAHPPQFPPFQSYAPVPPPEANGPQEVYRNGVMYYNTQSQQHPPRSVAPLPKRPKAAIPIVPPPDKLDRNGVASNNDAGEMLGNSDLGGVGSKDDEPLVDSAEHYALQQLQLQRQEEREAAAKLQQQKDVDGDPEKDVTDSMEQLDLMEDESPGTADNNQTSNVNEADVGSSEVIEKEPASKEITRDFDGLDIKSNYVKATGTDSLEKLDSEIDVSVEKQDVKPVNPVLEEPLRNKIEVNDLESPDIKAEVTNDTFIATTDTNEICDDSKNNEKNELPISTVAATTE